MDADDYNEQLDWEVNGMRRQTADIEESLSIEDFFDSGVNVRPRSVYSDGHYTIKLVD
jgi:hypothetical protein